MRPPVSRVTIKLSPARSIVKKSPGRASESSRPTQSHSCAKTRSRSVEKTSGEVYQEAGNVFAPAPTFGRTNVSVMPETFLSALTESARTS